MTKSLTKTLFFNLDYINVPRSEQFPAHIVAPNGGYCLYYQPFEFKYYFRNTRGLESWRISLGRQRRESQGSRFYVPFSHEVLKFAFILSQSRNITHCFPSISSLEVKLVAAFSFLFCMWVYAFRRRFVLSKPP